MDVFEVFEGGMKDKSVCIALRADFARKLSGMLIDAYKGNRAVFALAKQIETATNVVEGVVRLEDVPESDLPNFSLAEEDEEEEEEEEVPAGIT